MVTNSEVQCVCTGAATSPFEPAAVAGFAFELAFRLLVLVPVLVVLVLVLLFEADLFELCESEDSGRD